MFKKIGPSKLFRAALNQYNCKLSSDTKISEQKSESNLVKAATTEIAYNPKDVKKDDLIWRTAWHEKHENQYTLLRTFYKEESNASLLKWLQTPVDLSPQSIKNWWMRKTDFEEAFLQQYIPERHHILGPELATAHFIVYRGGAVKFHNDDKWIKAVDGEYELPPRYQQDMFLQAIDCTDMNLYYEGLDNMRELRNVEWLSLNGCKHMEDFCLDVISNIFSHSLVYLDLRNCYNITENGIGALYKMRNLKILYLDDLMKDTKFELTCMLLQEVNPQLQIKSDVINFDISK